MAGISMSLASSGLRAMQAKLDLHSNNIANAQTPGYRRQEALLRDQAMGGVNAVSKSLFNPVTANRISQLEGLAASTEVKAASLNKLQTTLSATSGDLGTALNSFREAIGSAADRPQDASLRGVVAAQAAGLAAQATDGLTQLDTQLVDIGQEQAGVRTAAADKMKALASLNDDVAQSPDNPNLRNSQAQVGKELAELIGGEIKFGLSGQATFSVGGTTVVSGNSVGAIPADAGGKLGGLQASSDTVKGFRDLFSKTLDSFSSTFNDINKGGTTTAKAAGSELFSFDGKALKFVGSANTLALDTAGGSNGLNARKMLGVNTLASDTGNMAASAAAQANSAETEFGSKTATMQSTMQSFNDTEGVNLDQEMIEMKNAQRYYEANAKVIQTQDSMLGTLINMKA